MASVLDRSTLEQSPLADLHLIGNELGVDGFRRLRKADLIDAILTKGGGEDAPAAEPDADADTGADVATEPDTETDDDEGARRPRRGRRGGGRSRSRGRGEEGATDEDAGGDEAETPRRGRARDRDRGADRDRAADRGTERGTEREEERSIEGVIDLLANGSGFVRLTPPDATDEDVYISAAQVKRCELVSGDRVAGPVRAPRRSERFPSLVRVDTINGRPAEEVAEGTRFEDLPAAYPAERFELGSEDPTVQAIEWLTPIGKGSRAVLAGPSRSGKSEALGRLGTALAGREGLEVTLVLAGVRPEEIGEWRRGSLEPIATLSFAASGEAQTQAVEQAVEQARRVAARGGDAVVLIDSLDHVAPAAARRALAAARNIDGGGSLTIIATSTLPIGGETTVVTFDQALTALGRFPAIDLLASGTLRAELLVGEAGAQAIAAARAEQAGG